ncbi:rhoptry protein ROP1 [Toxoplasma gondii VAND]|uniref:Rhoptry protein ROP1 n=1 Tax=Toxoplasma gondii VAND TaxID=933077 RepID=A0A086PQ31_TOXGO|nr:rhoptry protein ROP1 [Toxoplasma gondii VAND]
MEQRLPIILLVLSVFFSSTPSAALSSHNGVPAYPSYAQVSLSSNGEPRHRGIRGSFLMPVKPHANADDFASDDNYEPLPSFVEAPVRGPDQVPARGEAALVTEEAPGQQPPVALGSAEGEGTSTTESASEISQDDDTFHDALQELPEDGLEVPPPNAQELPPPNAQELPPPNAQELPPPNEQELPPPNEQVLPPPNEQELPPPVGEGQGLQVPGEHGPQGPPDDDQLLLEHTEEQQEGPQEPAPPTQGDQPEGQQPQGPVRQNLFRRALGAARSRFGGARRHVSGVFRRVRGGLNRVVGGVRSGFRRARESVVGGVRRFTGGASRGLRRVREGLRRVFNRVRGRFSRGDSPAADGATNARHRYVAAGAGFGAGFSFGFTRHRRPRTTSGEEGTPLLGQGREQDGGSQ